MIYAINDRGVCTNPNTIYSISYGKKTKFKIEHAERDGNHYFGADIDTSQCSTGRPCIVKGTDFKSGIYEIIKECIDAFGGHLGRRKEDLFMINALNWIYDNLDK